MHPRATAGGIGEPHQHDIDKLATLVKHSTTCIEVHSPVWHFVPCNAEQALIHAEEILQVPMLGTCVL